MSLLDPLTFFEDLNALTSKEYKHSSNNTPKLNQENVFKILQNIKASEYQKIITWVSLQDNVIPLEYLWILHKTNVLQFTTYIYQNTRLISALSDEFKDLIWSENANKEFYSNVLIDLLTELVNVGNHSPRHISKPCRQLLHLVMKQMIEKLQGDSVLTDSPCFYLEGLYHNTLVVGKKLRSLCIIHLCMLIQYEANTVLLTEAVQEQAKCYTCNKISPVIANFYTKIFEMLQTKDAVEEIKRIVSNQQFNWKWLLVGVSCMMKARAEYCEVLKQTIDAWLSGACSTGNSHQLAAAVLCARQCCAEDAKRFGSYSAWFGSLQLRTASSFHFFIQFLSQLVPHEPALYLKIHVNKVPSPPSHCLTVLSDYVTLAKTRLADLKETTDYVGLFSEYVTTEQEGRESDVAKVIAHFTQHQEVLKTVLEASVFRRQFYEKVFLPELLKIRENVDPHRGRLIRKLNSLGKVPARMFQEWCDGS